MPQSGGSGIGETATFSIIKYADGDGQPEAGQEFVFEYECLGDDFMPFFLSGEHQQGIDEVLRHVHHPREGPSPGKWRCATRWPIPTAVQRSATTRRP